MATEVKVPALGESITEATLGQWLKKPGDAVAVDEPIASLETDKVSVEVPSPVAGVFGEALVGEGDTVAVGAVIATVGENGVSAQPQAAAQATAPAAGSRRSARTARSSVGRSTRAGPRTSARSAGRGPVCGRTSRSARTR